MITGETLSSREDLGPNSFEFYDALLRDINMRHPQRYGLTYEEFSGALTNPEVLKTSLLVEGREVMLPQLGPLDQYHWLNAPRYYRDFPDKEIVHYFELPGIEAGEPVCQALQRIAARQGVVVFDYPSDDTQYADRFLDLLARQRIDSTEVRTLADQTYFAGQVKFKRAKDRAPDHMGFDMAFDALKADGSFENNRYINGTVLEKHVEPEAAARMYDFYEAAYTRLNEDEFCNQGLSPEEFMHMMTQEPGVIKLLNKVGGQTTGLMLLDNNLERLSWVNAAYYRNLFPQKYDNGQVIWFPGLAADPKKHGVRNTQALVNLIGELAERGGNEILVVFDCGIINTGFLDVFLNGVINRGPHGAVDIQPIAQHKYAAVQLTS